MTLLDTWPTTADDDGTGQTGTSFDKTFTDGMKSAIEALVHNTQTGPPDLTGITPADIIDEVVTARGNLTSLEDRLDGVIDSNGALIVPATIATQANLQSIIGTKNLAKDSLCEYWAEDVASAPVYWEALTNATVAISGTGQSAATERKVGDYCIALTWTSGTGSLDQTIVPSGNSFTRFEVVADETQKVGFGMWIKTGVASQARVQIYDGVDTTNGTNSVDNAEYHSGSGNWEWISGVHTFNASATEFTLRITIEAAGTAYYSGHTVVLGDFAPLGWIPEDQVHGTVVFKFVGTPVASNNAGFYIFQKPAIVEHIQCFARTAPTTGGVDMDLQKQITGASWESILGGAKTDMIAQNDKYGEDLPDATQDEYHRRCFVGSQTASGVTHPVNSIMRLDLDVTENVVDLYVLVRVKQLVDQLAGVLAYNEK
jgi:hypothetical protein